MMLTEDWYEYLPEHVGVVLYAQTRAVCWYLTHLCASVAVPSGRAV